MRGNFSGRIQKRLFADDFDSLRGLRGFALRTVRVAVLAVREFRADFCLERAMSLAFATLISLFPLTVLFVTVASSLGTAPAVGAESAGQPNVVIRFVEEKVFYALAPEFRDPLKKWFRETESFDRWPTGIINLIAVVVLFLSALGVLLTAERVFNRIWKVPGRRSYFQKVTTFWVILTTSPMMIIASIWVGELVTESGPLGDLAHRDGWIGFLYNALLPVSIGFFGFTLLFLFMPSARVKLASAAVGGFVAAILWEISKKGFSLYIVWAGRETNLYSHVFAVPLFLLWMYLTWIIALVGGEVSYVHQHLRLLSRDRRETRARRHSLAFFGVYMLARSAAAFLRRTPLPPLSAISGDLDCDDESIAGDVADWLVERGYLVEDGRAPGTFALARDSRQIELRDIVDGLESLEFPGECADPGAVAEDSLGIVGALFGALRRAAKGELGSETLEDLVDRLKIDPTPETVDRGESASSRAGLTR